MLVCCGLSNHTTIFVAWTEPLKGLSKHPLWYFLLCNVAKKAEKAVHALLPPSLTVWYGCEHVFAGGHRAGVLCRCISRPLFWRDEYLTVYLKQVTIVQNLPQISEIVLKAGIVECGTSLGLWSRWWPGTDLNGALFWSRLTVRESDHLKCQRKTLAKRRRAKISVLLFDSKLFTFLWMATKKSNS